MKKDKKRIMFVNPCSLFAIIVTTPLTMATTIIVAKDLFIGPPSLDSFVTGMLLLVMFNLPNLLLWYKRVFCFFVYDSKGIKKGKQLIPWENVCITMYDGGQSIFREPNTACLFYLSDHYVTREEIAYGETHGGMFFIVTDKRLKKIFKYYDKQVNIICRMNRNSYLTSLVISHNLHWDKPSNTEK